MLAYWLIKYMSIIEKLDISFPHRYVIEFLQGSTIHSYIHLHTTHMGNERLDRQAGTATIPSSMNAFRELDQLKTLSLINQYH